MGRSNLLLVIAAGSLAATGTSSSSLAHAQESEAVAAGESPDRLSEARELFSDGVRYAGDGEFGRAVTAFRRALELHEAPTIRYNLASALFETGQLAEAHAAVEPVIDNAEAPAELRQRAEELRETIRGHSARVTIRLGGQADAARLDGRDLTLRDLDAALIVAPGAHSIVGLRGGEEVTTREIDVPAGGQAFVDVSVVPSPAEVAAAAEPALAGDQEAQPSTPLLKDWRLWTAVGGGVVAVVLVVVIVAAASGGGEDPIAGNFEPGLLTW